MQKFGEGLPEFDWRAEFDGRSFSPSALRNAEPIRAALAQHLPEPCSEGPRPLVLEIAAGTGQHAVHMARHFPHLDWLASDPDPALGASLAAWARQAVPPAGPKNLLAPRAIDAAAPDWGLAAAEVRRLAAIVAINMVHIAPWAATEGLVAGAGRYLPRGGTLYLYGPYRREGRPTAPSNLRFDAALKARNPAWGLRSVEAVAALAEAAGLALAEVVEMPANNLSLVFRKA